MASVASDAPLHLWSLADGRELARHHADVPFARVAVADDRIVTGDVTGNLMIFDVDWSATQP